MSGINSGFRSLEDDNNDTLHAVRSLWLPVFVNVLVKYGI